MQIVNGTRFLGTFEQCWIGRYTVEKTTRKEFIPFIGICCIEEESALSSVRWCEGGGLAYDAEKESDCPDWPTCEGAD